MKLDLQRVSFIEDARRMLNGATLSVSRLYSITGVDWLIAASINFSSTTALRFADLEGLPSNNTMGPVNARPLQDVRLNHDERNREESPGRFLTARAPIGQHVKIFRQMTTPPGHVKERVYPKLVNQDGDAQRYGGLTATKKDETIFAAYDKAEMRKAKIMVVANSEFVYTSKSLFWPDVIMLAAVDLDLLQSVSLAIGVQRQTEMNPITIVFAGINDHLHSRGFLSRIRDSATAENAVWPAIKDILESMGEVVDATKEGSFNKVTLRVVFALSPGYAHLPDGLKFVYAMVALLSEGKYDVIISAPNRMIEMENLRPLKAELPAVWSDISNAMRGFKDHALHMLVLDEVLGLELSNFSRQLKLKPGIDDDHRVITAMSNDLWFRAMEVASEDTRRKNSLETRAHLEAMVLRTKPEANQWLHLNPRVAALGADAFQQGPVMITKIHAYLLKEVNLAENAGEKTAEFVNRMCHITLETSWTQEVKGQEGFERTDSMLEGLGAGWTASFLAKVYPKVSHYLIKEFLQAVVKVSIVELIALFVTFGAESFVKGPAILLTDGIQNLRLDGLLTLIAITHGNLGGLMKLARCPEQMKERVRNLDMKKSTDSWNKIRDLRHTLIQYLLQQNRFGTGEDETIEREEDVRRHVGGMPLLTDLSLAMRIDPLALIRGVTEFVTVIYGPAVTFAFPDVKVEAYRRSVLHLNLISAVDGSTLNWCEQHALRELMSEDLLFAKISEPEMTVINFDDHFCEEADNDEQGPSNSNKDKSEGDDGQGGSRQTEEPMQQDQAGGEDDRASTGGTSSLDFNIFSDLENNADTLEATESADEGTSTLEPPSAFMEMKRNLPESSSPGNSRNNDQRILMESPRRRRIEASARVPFLGTLPEEEWEVHHRDHESRTGCKLDRVAFMEEVWTVVQSYVTQSILKTGLNQPLMREVLDKLDECEGRLSELLVDSATDESEANSPIKMTPQDDEGEVVYLSRTRRGTMRSKMVIDKINAMKMKLGSRVMPRRIGKTKVDSEISMKAGNSAKRKRVEEVMDLGQGDYQLSGTDRILTDIAMVPPILMAGIKSTGYKSKRSDRTLTGATLEMEILSQCGESKMRDFKPSPMNHGKGSVAGQLTPVEYNRLTVSETVSIDEPTGGYMEMLEYRNSARGYVMALEDEKAMEAYLEMMLQGTTLKQKAYGTLASSDVEAETIDQLVSLPWKAVVLRYFEEEMRTTPRIHALVAVPYVRTELQLRFAWCMMGLTREEYDSEERKRSKEEKVFLMTNLRDLIVQEGAAVACAKRRDALCFIRFLIEQISVLALNTCVKMSREGDERTKALFLLAMLDMQQSKPMRVNMKEPEELKPMKKIDEIRRFSNKELRLTKESMGALPKSSEYCGPFKKKSYSYVSGIIGIAYNPFLSEDIRDCFFDYEQAVLLRFWTSRIVTIKSVNNPQAKLGLVLEEEVTAPSVPKSDKRVEFGLGFSDELQRTSLMAVWELMRPSWCPSPNADSILRATQDVQRELNADCNLRDLNIIYNVMITASKNNGEDKVELPGWGPEDWVKPGSCLTEVCGLEGHVCGSLDCVKTLEKQHKQLTVLFGNVVMKARTETELIADCHGGTDVNLVTALGFYSMFGSLESLLNLEQKHEMVTAISVEVFPGVLQTE